MSKAQTQIVSYAYAGAGALALLSHPGLLSFLDSSIPGPAGAMASVLTWAFLLGCLSGALGTAKQRWWGFAGLYVPFIINAFPLESRAVPLLVLNAVFLIGLVLLHLAVARHRAAV
jgi:hypothetical protein